MATCERCGTAEELDIRGDPSLFFECTVCMHELEGKLALFDEVVEALRWHVDHPGSFYEASDLLAKVARAAEPSGASSD